ncbi:MAG: nucleoside hydrolase [Verrucomicrobia bacterium]|nr:nucleoside hydrolase [Verrucomicrobiota bacterium]
MADPVAVHLDTDIGGDIDDLCALAFLLGATSARIAGITTCSERDGRRAGYARHILALAGRRDVPVCAGANSSLARYRLDPSIPDEASFWAEPVAPAPGPVEAALDLLVANIEAGTRVIAIGPLTNLALAEERCAGLLARTDLIAMGGWFDPPPPGIVPWTFRDDFNLQLDVTSAEAVLTRAGKLTLVPTTVTVQTFLRRSHLGRLEAAGRLGALLARQARCHDAAWRSMPELAFIFDYVPEDFLNFQHDPLTCAVALGWTAGVGLQECRVAVALESGWLRTRIDPAGRPATVASAVQDEAFADYWLSTVTRNA